MRILLSAMCVLGCAGLLRSEADNPNDPTVVAGAAIQYLQKLQNKDGGFRRSADRPESSLYATTAALAGFRYFAGEPLDGEACAAYIRRCFNRSSGGFAPQPGGKPDVLATAAGLRAAIELRLPADPYLDGAFRFLKKNARTHKEICAAAEAVGTLQPPRMFPQAAVWLKEINKHRGANGVAGSGSGTAVDTAVVLTAALSLGGAVRSREAVLSAIYSGQRPDGGFGKAGSKRSDLGSTYQVALACDMLGAEPDTGRIRAFVRTCRNADGGFGPSPGQPSTAAATYRAGFLLSWEPGKE